MGHLWHKSVSERLRFTSSVAEFTAATWTTGCSRNASSRKSTTEQRWKAEEEMTRISTQSSLRSQRLFSLTSPEDNSMLKISFSETPAEERWILHGLLTDPWVQQFRACWKKSHRTDVQRDCIVDLNEVTFIDKCGERLLRLLAKDGAKFTASGTYPSHILERLNVRRKRNSRNLLGFLMVVVFVTVLGAGCERGVASAPEAPAPTVEVTPVIQKDVPVQGEWVGTLEGYVNAQISPGSV